MIIRPASPADIPEIARLHVAGWQGAYGGLIDPDFIASHTIESRSAQWRDWLSGENFHVRLAVDDEGKGLGFISYGRIKTPPPGSSPIRPLYAAEVYALYLLPEVYRRGLGTALLREAAAHLRGLKMPSLCLWVLEKNERGVAFYKKMGGERIGRKDVTFGRTKAREICFGWRDTSALSGNSAS